MTGFWQINLKNMFEQSLCRSTILGSKIYEPQPFLLFSKYELSP